MKNLFISFLALGASAISAAILGKAISAKVRSTKPTTVRSGTSEAAMITQR